MSASWDVELLLRGARRELAGDEAERYRALLASDPDAAGFADFVAWVRRDGGWDDVPAEEADCPDPAVLAGLAERTLDEAAAGAAIEHASRCGRCVELLESALDELRSDALEVSRDALDELRAGARGLVEPGPAEGAPEGLSERNGAPVWKVVLLAAAAVLLVTFVPWGGGARELAAIARVEPIEVRVTRDAPDPASFEGVLRTGLDEYAAGDLATAAVTLARARELKPADPRAALFHGSALLLTDRVDDAFASLLDAAQARDAGLRNEARWQLAQVFLLRGDEAEARRLLQLLADDASERATQASTQLAELDER